MTIGKALSFFKRALRRGRLSHSRFFSYVMTAAGIKPQFGVSVVIISLVMKLNT